MDTAWRNWGEQVVKAINALTGRLNEHTVTLPGLQADVAVLIDAVLRKDAELDAMRAWTVELETRIARLEVLGYQTVTYTNIPSTITQQKVFVTPTTTDRIVFNTTTDGTDDGAAKL